MTFEEWWAALPPRQRNGVSKTASKRAFEAGATSFKKTQKLELPFSYICFPCANERGGKWPEGHCATCHNDTCPYCKAHSQLACISDWNWPDAELNKRLIHGRD